MRILVHNGLMRLLVVSAEVEDVSRRTFAIVDELQQVSDARYECCFMIN